ncbi:type VII secretion target [Nocardia acidivorans]|uniref:type VII secretion target n=1 Tax=Nocardia acidivorans TaxID=404580 RepID=UPI0009FF5D6D|nr:type VII secretion target [Nocardia acidivorans]
MADHLLIEPDDLRKSAEQHALIAAELRRKGAIPQPWLDEFPETYGTIADPIHGALVDFYNDRYAKADRLAREHERTRDQLLRAADDLEAKDEHGRQRIAQAGGDNHPGGAGPSTPNTDPVTPAPIIPVPSLGGTPPKQSIVPVPDGRTPTPTAAPSAERNIPQPESRMAGGTPVGQIAPVGSTTPVGPSTPVETNVPFVLAPSTSSIVPPRSMGPGTNIPNAPVTTAAPAASPPRIAAPDTGPRSAGGIHTFSTAPDPVASTAVPRTGPPRALVSGPLSPGPLAASARSAGAKRAEPSLVVGDTVADHLTLARTLLAAVLATVGDSTPGMEWATAVAITRRGPVLMLTSTEGRGWLPAGLFLPSEVIVPWRWKSRFDERDRQTMAKLAGIDDPARMLAELVALTTHRIPIRLSALASSTAVSNRLRSSLPVDTAVADHVPAAPADADFSKPGAGLVDRLEIAGTDNTRHYAEGIADMDILVTCQKLVIDTQIQTGSVARSRDGFIRRRTDELRRLYADTETDRQLLRDMLYTYEQIVMHPQAEMATMPQDSTGAGSSRIEMSI